VSAGIFVVVARRTVGAGYLVAVTVGGSFGSYACRVVFGAVFYTFVPVGVRNGFVFKAAEVFAAPGRVAKVGEGRVGVGGGIVGF